MKLFLQNLLIFCCACLCALISYQWVRELGLRKDIQQLTRAVDGKLEAIKSLQASVRWDEAEIQRLDGLKNQLIQSLRSNDAQVATLARSLEKTTAEFDQGQKQLEAYKSALETANASILRQNDEINKQNDEMARLAAERNEVVRKFNDLAERWNRQQADLARAATNGLPPPAEKK
jgi:chromosome segregation ATPase